ncbi:MAG TPA: SDR family oxidoreductase [Solirubrobacteraceae bacterium]|nr:SDR family oxidoreductase [Solirubrobacteraceae bacterium]
MELAKRTILVTGASGGIGRHIVEALHARGARVVATGRDEARLRELPAVAHLTCDLRDSAQTQELVDRAEAAAGAPLDGLVLCAGVEHTGAYSAESVAELEEIVRVNLTAPMVLIRAALPGMLARGRGHVVGVSSISGRGPSPYLASYATTKAALHELMASLRLEHRGTGVSFSSVSPGFIAREGMYARMQETGHNAPITLGTSAPERVGKAVADAFEQDKADRIVAARPMRPLFALNELTPKAGDAGVVAVGARRFLRKVAVARGRGS